MSRARTQAGFTLYEVTVVIALMALAGTAVAQLFKGNTELVNDTRALQRAEAAHRRNLGALTRVLRGIDIQTLAGFDSQGMASSPSFGRVTGADLDDFTYRGDEKLSWKASPVAVDGVVKPGAVYLVRDGASRLVADRIPAGGFFVRQQGQSLVIHLTTFFATGAGRVVSRSSESVVSIRN